MKKFIKNKITYVIAGLAIVSSGCEKIINPEPVGEQTIEANFTDFNGALNATNGIYAQLTNGNLYKGDMHQLNIDEASDDVLDIPQGQSASYSKIDYFELTPDNSLSFGLWDDYYRIIYRSNVVIARVPAINFQTIFSLNATGTSFKEQFVGEAKFLRAFAYFNLVRTFGGVPLITEEIKAVSEIARPRASVADIYTQIEKDLTEAAAALPLSYTGAINGNEKGRVTKWTALAMLADVYLTQKKYPLAKSTAQTVIQNSSGFKLNNAYSDNFYATNGSKENTQESLFEIQLSAVGIANNRSAPQGNNYAYVMGPVTDIIGGVPSIAKYRPTDDASLDANEPGFTGGLIQEYEAGDLRLSTNFAMGRSGTGTTVNLTKKFYEPARGAAGNGNFPVYRMAEMYLIYAEATNEDGAPDALSIDYINQLRRRAFGLPLTTVSVKDVPSNITQGPFRDIIRSERRKELAMEGKRWYDLLRYGFPYAENVLKVKQKRANFTQNKMLFPIADVERRLNPALTQNPL